MKRRPLADEAGLAMITVVMLATALLLIMAVVFARGLAQFGNTSQDALWEQALAAAESGLNLGLASVEADGTYTTGEVLSEDLVGSSSEKAWVMAAAEAHPDEDVVRTSDGEFVVIRPSNYPLVFSVGYAPSRDAEDRRVRVVRARFETEARATAWTTRLAFLAGGSLEFRGNPTFLTGAAVGIHTNASIDVGGSTFADGCVTASGEGHVSGAFVQPPECPIPGGQPIVVIPVVDPRAHWSESEYDLCPDGKVRAGPAHVEYGNTAVNAPCTGSALVASAATTAFRGWKFFGCCDQSRWATWKYEANNAHDGVYYVYEGTAVIVSSPGAELLPWEVSILAEAHGSECGALQGGDIIIAGNPEMTPHSSTGNLQLLAGRDIDIAGNANFSGLAAAHEQIEITGDLDVQDGSFLAESGECDTPGSPVPLSYVGGGATVNNNGPIATELSAPVFVLVARTWVEL